MQTAVILSMSTYIVNMKQVHKWGASILVELILAYTLKPPPRSMQLEWVWEVKWEYYKKTKINKNTRFRKGC